ncbi:hypothetical protein [Mesorhizobium sophorae]|uniref:hypothetical protein n=1 Tax=Mesorhizobium sophorae TaxID=1300294 RepID=UPI001FD8C454|nr:hypothetical protein [Mesorhizobium sophorae]
MVHRFGRLCTASICFAISVCTGLRRLGRVDAIEADALAMDFDCVTVDDGSTADQILLIGGSFALRVRNDFRTIS